jgi:hypothetical protein
MITIMSASRAQAPPANVIFESLTDPNHEGSRIWLNVRNDELWPSILEAVEASRATWSSIWPERPDARIQFDIRKAGSGTMLRWSITVAPPEPDEILAERMTKRINQIINRDLRKSFGQ